MADESGTPTSGEVALEATSAVKAPRRRALWGVLAVVAVAAGALAISAGGDGGTLPTLPVALGASGGDEASGAASADADLRMMGWVTYVAGDGLPALGGEGPVYKLDGSVDEARVRALAAALGLSGDPTNEDGYWHLQTEEAILEVYEEGGGYWWYGIQPYEIQPDEGGGSPGCEPGPAVDCGVTAPSPILPDGPVTTIAQRDATASGSCTTYEGKDGSTVEECVSSAEPCPPDAPCTLPAPTEPQPPADLPSQDEAREIALDLLRATGMDLTDATVTVDGPYDAWYVTVERTVDGLPVTGWVSSVAVGSKGAITNASGTFATPELVGDYPLIDTRDAIDRLNEQQQDHGYDDVRPLGAPGTASSSREAATLEAPADAPLTTIVCTTGPDGAESCGGTGGDPGAPAPPPEYPECAADDPAVADVDPGVAPDTAYPCGPYPEPEPIEIVLDHAESVLVLLPAVDGSGDSYLLSGYRLTGAEGAIVEVVAVAEESLAPTTETTVPDPDTTLPAPEDCARRAPMEPCRGDEIEPTLLEPGQTPEMGVGYYVDVNTHCGWFVFADRWWATDAQTPLDWATPTEGGTFTLTSPDGGTFVGDMAATKTADFTARGPAEDLPGCA